MPPSVCTFSSITIFSVISARDSVAKKGMGGVGLRMYAYTVWSAGGNHTLQLIIRPLGMRIRPQWTVPWVSHQSKTSMGGVGLRIMHPYKVWSVQGSHTLQLTIWPLGKRIWPQWPTTSITSKHMFEAQSRTCFIHTASQVIPTCTLRVLIIIKDVMGLRKRSFMCHSDVCDCVVSILITAAVRLYVCPIVFYLFIYIYLSI